MSADVAVADAADGPADAVRPVDDADVLLGVSGAEVAVEGDVQSAVQQPAVVTADVLAPVPSRTGPAGVTEPGQGAGYRGYRIVMLGRGGDTADTGYWIVIHDVDAGQDTVDTG